MDFPSKTVADQKELLEILHLEIMGTKQTRFGPLPSIESQAAIRGVIRHYTAANQPIPFMVPWGSEKPDGTGIDIAELCALRMLKCLGERVAGHYGPGVQFNIRVEDVSAPHLFVDRQEEARREAELYSSGLQKLVDILEVPFIKVVRGSNLIDEKTFNAKADEILPAMSNYVWAVWNQGAVQSTHKAVQDLGWKGELDYGTIQHYLKSYISLYPTKSHEEHLEILARYFSGALARAVLNLRGDDPKWNGVFLDLSFLPPISGTEDRFLRRIHYRTVPSSLTSNHLAPWRCRGLCLVGEDGIATPKLYSLKNPPENLNRSTIEVSNDHCSVVVNADYVLE